MAHKQNLPEWIGPLDKAIQNLVQVHNNFHGGNLHTAEDYLSAAVSISQAIELLQPTTKDADGEDTPSLITCLVRASRDETLVKKPATWTAAAEALGLDRGQRAFDLYSESSSKRKDQARARSAVIRAEMPARPKPDLPGLSMDEARAHFGGVSRTRIRTMVTTGLLHAHPLLNPDGTPVLLSRSGKEVPQLRYYPHTTGKSAEVAAVELGTTVETVAAMGEREEIGRAKVLVEGTQEPLQTDGGPVWAYWPEHRKTQ